MALLVLLTTATGTGFIAPHLFLGTNGLYRLRFLGSLGLTRHGGATCRCAGTRIVFLRTQRAQIGSSALLRFSYLTGIPYGDVRLGQGRYYRLIVFVDHPFEKVERLKLVNQQGVFLLVGGILYRLFQIVEFTKMLFPGLVNGNEHNGLFKRLGQFLTFRFISLFKIGGDLENPMTIGDGYHDVLIDFGLGFKNIFHYRIGLTGHMLNFPEVTLPNLIVQLIGQFLCLALHQGILIKGTLGRENPNQLHFEGFKIVALLSVLYQSLNGIEHHIGDFDLHALSVQSSSALGVNHLTLRIHYIVVLQQTLTNTEVVFFYFFLSSFDRLGNHTVLNHLSVFHAQAIHILHQSVRPEQTHQIVFQRDKELRRTGVALATGTSAQLAVNPTRFVPFGTHNGQTSGRLDFGRQFDVGSPTGHVGGNGYNTLLTGLGHNVRFPLVQLGVQDIMLNAP